MRSLALAICLLSSPSVAHELWIEPTQFQVEADTIATADVVNGQDFIGVKLAYIPRQFNRFVAVNGGKFSNIEGRIGNRPAMSLEPLGEGLHVIAYLSTISVINYEEWQKFQDFVDHKDLGNARANQEARGFELEDFDEAYTRYSKSLLGVGNSEGSDRRLGLLTEFVALDNPYTSAGITEMRLQLFYGQDQRANEQVEIFEKAADGTVAVTLYRTDEEGIAVIPVKAGHSYMADAVVLREPSAELAEETGAIWETLWANITWAVPE